MIKAQDLRIGNFVELNGSYGQVEAVDKYNNIKVFDYYPVCQIKPIPLTEEILLKCGFEKSNYSKYNLVLDVQNLQLTARCFSKISFQIGDLYLGDTNLKYLHQLQNFCSVFGEELNVKL